MLITVIPVPFGRDEKNSKKGINNLGSNVIRNAWSGNKFED